MNDLVHFAMGVSIAGAFGFTGRRRWALGLFAVAPDWDALTTPAIPYLITWLDLGHEAGHRLVIALGHGAFSHSLIATVSIVAIAWASGLRGRSLAAAATAVASHYPLDFVLTWSVWPLLPFSKQGISWGVVTTGDVVVTSLAAAIGILMFAVDLRAWRKRRSGDPAPFVLPAWVGTAAILVIAGSLVVPAIVQTRMLREHAPGQEAVADPISYTQHALIVDENDTFHMLLVDARSGIIGEMRVPRVNDTTGGAGAHALGTIRRALTDADAPSPLVRPLLTARAGEGGGIIVEAREASTVLASRYLGEDAVGLDFEFNDEGEVEAVFARKGDRSARLPAESLPTFVELAQND